jgi:hypothetical protein
MKGKPLGGSRPLGLPRPPGKVPRTQNNMKLIYLVKYDRKVRSPIGNSLPAGTNIKVTLAP